MKLCVLVHPGSLFTSGKASVPTHLHADVVEGITRDIAQADGLVVIDGFLSDGVPRWFTDLVEARLDEVVLQQEPAFRLWGCDSGETPYEGWHARGDGCVLISDSQQVAAARVAPFLMMAREIVVTGAWATRDGSSGCVNSVAEVLQEHIPSALISVSEHALYEDYRDEDPEP